MKHLLPPGIRWIAFAVVFIAFSLFLAGPITPIQASSTIQQPPPTPQPAEPPSARRGRVIYQQNCAPCHGELGLGNGPGAADLQFPPTQFADAAVARQATLAQWFDVAKNGRMERMMPPWGNQLSDDEIWDAVTYAWTLHLDPGELDLGKEVYQANCARCHGDQGRGDGPDAPPDIPDLTAPESAYQRSLAEWFISLTEGHQGMPSFAESLTEDQLWASLEYARSLSYKPVSAPTFEPGPGVITGTVTNATPPGGPMRGITVTLRVFDSQVFEELRNFEATTDERGIFRFEGLPTSSDWAYMVTLNYKDVPYASAVQSFPPDQNQLNLPIRVYETTEDGSGIRIERAHWFIDFDGQNLLVGELYIISQDGDRVYVGAEEVAPGQRVTLRFPLPAGYQGLSVDPGPLGERFFEVNGSVVDTLPMPPGQGVRQIFLSYRYPYQGRSLDFQHQLAYPTARLNVLIADVGVKVSSPQVVFRDKQGISGQQYLNLEGENLPAGQLITLSFKRLPQGDPTTSTVESPITAAVAAGVVAIMLGVVIYLAWRRGQPVAAPALDIEETGVTDLETERQRLLLAIARLDDEYEAGNIPEETYRRERARRKARLLEIVQQMQQGDAE